MHYFTNDTIVPEQTKVESKQISISNFQFAENMRATGNVMAIKFSKVWNMGNYKSKNPVTWTKIGKEMREKHSLKEKKVKIHNNLLQNLDLI